MARPQQPGRSHPSHPARAVPASPHHLGLLRAMVRTVAAQHALSMDALADLVLAVDEAAATLIDHAHPTSTLLCTFATTRDPTRLRITLTTTISSPLETSTASFGWLVLKTLVDHLTLEQTAAPGNDDPNVTITLETNLQGSP